MFDAVYIILMRGVFLWEKHVSLCRCDAVRDELVWVITIEVESVITHRKGIILI